MVRPREQRDRVSYCVLAVRGNIAKRRPSDKPSSKRKPSIPPTPTANNATPPPPTTTPSTTTTTTVVASRSRTCSSLRRPLLYPCCTNPYSIPTKLYHLSVSLSAGRPPCAPQPVGKHDGSLAVQQGRMGVGLVDPAALLLERHLPCVVHGAMGVVA